MSSYFKEQLQKHLPHFEEEDIDFFVNDMMRGVEFHSLNSPEVRAAIKEGLDDFIYWKKPDLFGINLFSKRLSHSIILEHFFCLEQAMNAPNNPKMKDFLDTLDFCSQKYSQGDVEKTASYLSELFLFEGCGYYLSSARGYGQPPIKMGDKYSLTAQEKLLFKNHRFVIMEP